MPAMTVEPNSFSALGLTSPVVHAIHDDGTIQFFYAGSDGVTPRVGLAGGAIDRPWPQQRFPTVGDTLGFITAQGRTGASVIELAQSNQVK